ncbi:MAG TPA: ABC transporter substrate-binding protein [Syntrophus sp. (in: bacteria)]|nr:ABC transporter substrate-binding protein [Syntrophus sp. (in: bacteria)]
MSHAKTPFSFASLAIALLAAVILAGNACRQETPPQQTGPPEKITIAYSTASNAMLMYLAFANGYFTEEGLDATPQPHAFGKPALASVINGKADLATAGDTPIVFAVMDGKKISVLATIQTSNRNEAIIVRQDRGIMKPSDLKGKKIGLTVGTTGDFFANSFFLVHGIARKQVTIIDLKPDEMAAALASGRVDAVSTWNPTLLQLQKALGDKGLIFFDDAVYTENFCVAAGQDFVKKHPEAIKKVLRALIKAENFVKQHPEASRRLVADFIKADKTFLDETWGIFTLRVTLDQSLLVNLEDQTRWAMKNLLTTGKDIPNYLDFIHVDGLLAVKPEAVRIIR